MFIRVAKFDGCLNIHSYVDGLKGTVEFSLCVLYGNHPNVFITKQTTLFFSRTYRCILIIIKVFFTN
jgi:hypothetical protein